MEATLRVRTVVGYSVAVCAGMLAAVVVLGVMRVDAAPGESDATFVSMVPCRLADTRPAPNRIGTAGTFAANQTVTFAAHGTNGECTIPPDAVGLSLNVTATGATTQTFLTIWGDGDRPLASSLNPAPGQPPTPNAVTTPLSGSGSFQVYNLDGTVNVVIDVNGFYTKTSLEELDARLDALETTAMPLAVLDRLDALEAEVAALTTKSSSMSTLVVDGEPTVRFSGVNVQVVSGAGATAAAANGTGNLIIGYNEDLFSPADRSGSHNLVIGTENEYSSYGGIVAGTLNSATAPFATVTGGSRNTASGFASSATGGQNNQSSGQYASVSGGYTNLADDTYASVSGGADNRAIGYASSVTGGQNNQSNAQYASVSGGYSGNVVGIWDWRAGTLFSSD